MRRDLLKYDGQSLVLTPAGVQMASGSAIKVERVTGELGAVRDRDTAFRAVV